MAKDHKTCMRTAAPLAWHQTQYTRARVSGIIIFNQTHTQGYKVFTIDTMGPWYGSCYVVWIRNSDPRIRVQSKWSGQTVKSVIDGHPPIVGEKTIEEENRSADIAKYVLRLCPAASRCCSRAVSAVQWFQKVAYKCDWNSIHARIPQVCAGRSRQLGEVACTL